MGSDKGLNKLGTILNSRGEPEVQLFGPPNALTDDADGLSQGLYLLSEAIVRGLMPKERHGGLGGDFGYGADFENDVFMMHHDCGCEKEGECPWCTGCAVYQRRGACVVCAKPETTVEQRRAAPLSERCDYAAGRGIFSRFTPYILDHDRHYYDPPLFWHKASDFRVTWYKWIGRGMATNRDLTGDEWRPIWTSCWESIPVEAREQAQAEREHESTPEFRAEQDRMFQSMVEVMSNPVKYGAPCPTVTCQRCGKTETLEPQWTTPMWWTCADCHGR